MLEQDPLIAEYSHERHRPREAEALLTLRKIASMVKPIMRQRGWRVGVLTEFYPPETNLLGLNWNRGAKICLRLRYPGDERQFLPIENVVDTMLHELAHIVHGPHDAAFHALWDQLRDEHEALLRKGYTGEGFLSTGRKLGGSSRVPMHEARRRARAAAEQRRTLGQGSGQKLGGAPVRAGTDIRRVIANAAQRRINVTKGCASVDDTQRRGQLVEEAARNGFRTKAEEDDANEQAIMDAYIELIQEEERETFGSDYAPPSQQDPLGSQGRRRATHELAQAELAVARGSEGSSSTADPSKSKSKSLPVPAVPVQSKPAAPRKPSPPRAKSPHDDSWTCQICTAFNPPLFLICEACGMERFFEGAEAETMLPPPVPKRTSKPNEGSGRLTSSTTIDRSVRHKRSRDTLSRIAEWSAVEQQRPLGWQCRNCGNFTEREFWSCAACGMVKETS